VPSGTKPVYWSPENGDFDAKPLEGIDAVVHLAGESIASRWSAAQKERLYSSRVEGTRLLVNGLSSLRRRPSVLVSASAIGFYGNRGEEELDEESPAGTGFLPELCQAWEAEVAQATELGVRTVSLRTGVVLSSKGGALIKMLLPFKLGLGGPLGSGKQWMSWIHIDDMVAIHRLTIDGSSWSGRVNATAPAPVRQREFAKALGRALGRPAAIPAPSFAVKLALGEMGQRLLLEGQKVLPRRLQDSGYRFLHPELAGALSDLLS
jgi:uncharacterized protein (TIGR01777 family)